MLQIVSEVSRKDTIKLQHTEALVEHIFGAWFSIVQCVDFPPVQTICTDAEMSRQLLHLDDVKQGTA